MKYMTQYLCQIFLMACLAVSGAQANAQKSLNWRNGERYDKGTMQSIAMLPSGLVVESTAPSKPSRTKPSGITSERSPPAPR